MGITRAFTPGNTSEKYARAQSARKAGKAHRLAASSVAAELQKPEVYFDGGLHRDGFTVLVSRTEAPLVYGLDSFLVESQAQATQHLQIVSLAVGINFDVQHHGALILGAPRFF